MPNEQNGYCGPHSSPGDSGSSRESAETVRYQRRPGEHLGKGPYSGPIPRIRAKQLNHYNNQYETCSPTVRHKRNSRRLDTFGENAIETIYDEFRFLDEPDAPSPSSSSGQPILNYESNLEKSLQITPSLVAYCILPLIQLVISLSLLVLAVLRFRELFEDSVPSNILVDIDKPEGIATFPKESSDTGIIRVKSAASVFIPAMFHSISALAGFWPLIRKKKRCYQVIHILFSVLAILQWFNCIHSVAIEINVYLVQLQDLYQASSYVIYVVLLCAGYFGTIILPSITLCIASFQLIPYSKHGKGNIVPICLCLGTALISATIVCFSSYAASRSLGNIEQWIISSFLSNQHALYGFGLRETFISSYILISSIFFFIASIQRNVGLSVASSILQILCLLSLSSLLIPSRLSAVLQNARVLSIDKNAFPVSQVNIILLYAFLIVLLVVLSLQLISTIISLRKREPNIVISSIEPQERTTF